jgi:hypothetical protein
VSKYFLRWNAKKRLKDIGREASKLIVKIALKMETITKTLLSVSGQGGLTHSRPGEAPRLQTGLLRASIRTKAEGLRAKVGVFAGSSSLPYARALEYGSPMRGLAPRPFLRRAKVIMKQRFKDII